MRERISTPGKVRIGFVGTHPSLEKSEGWGTRLWADQGWVTRLPEMWATRNPGLVRFS